MDERALDPTVALRIESMRQRVTLLNMAMTWCQQAGGGDPLAVAQLWAEWALGKSGSPSDTIEGVVRRIGGLS